MFHTPAHKQADPAKRGAQIVNGYTPQQRQALREAALRFVNARSERSLARDDATSQR